MEDNYFTILLLSAIHQHESVISIHVNLPPQPPPHPTLSHPSISSQSTWFSSLLSRSFPLAAAAAAKSLQSCPTLYDPIDGSPTGSSVPWILQAAALYMAMHMCQCHSLHLFHPLLPHCVLSSVLHVCISFAVLQGVHQ